jgi:hypothetical protein
MVQATGFRRQSIYVIEEISFLLDLLDLSTTDGAMHLHSQSVKVPHRRVLQSLLPFYPGASPRVLHKRKQFSQTECVVYSIYGYLPPRI